MRWLLGLILAFSWLTAVGPSSSHAQAPTPVRARRSSPSVTQVVDTLRPYASRSSAGFGAEQSARPYSRQKPDLPPPVRSFAAVAERGVKDYFPAMRPGTYPNHNTVDPHSLCVPGRRALIMRGR